MTATVKLSARAGQLHIARKTCRHQEDYSDVVDAVHASEQKLWDWIYALEERQKEQERRHRR